MADGEQNTDDGARTEGRTGAVERFVERFGAELEAVGFPRMPARVFAALLAADDGSRTAAELSELLHVTPPSVSGAIRYLTQIGLVVRERVPGMRRESYRVYSDLWYEMFARRDRVLIQWQAELAAGVAAVGVASRAGLRLEESRQFCEFVRSEVAALMDRWQVIRATAVEF